MRINRLHLQNFRLFADREFVFSSQFTVLIGENGQGKSCVLNGLRVAASAWLLGLKEAKAVHILPEDIRRVEMAEQFVRQFPTVVEASGLVENQTIAWARRRADLKQGLSRTDRAEAKAIIELSRKSEQAANEEFRPVDFPVLAYFSTARLWVEAKQTIKLKTKGFRIQDGYAGALAPSHDRSSALGWIQANYLKAQDYYRQYSIPPSVPPSAPPSVMPSDPGHGATALLQAVLEAITTCLPEWTDLRWDWDENDLTGHYQRPDGQSSGRVPLFYLSDGLRTMAGMVAEIAYRCVVLNGHWGADAVRKSTGIVLIDELDMHLHPNWQRQVVADLKRAFPNLQFVATTHSPFIVQSLEASELLNLDHPTDLRPKDLRLEDVNRSIMGVTSSFSEENQQIQALTTAHLDLLGALPANADPAASTQAQAGLQALEKSIADPGLRALLALKRETSLPEAP